MESKIYEILAAIKTAQGIPFAYMNFKKQTSPPFIIYYGNGQYTDFADDKIDWKKNSYVIQYYFTKKNETNESAIEESLVCGGFNYVKGQDIYVDAEDIYYVQYIV